MPVWKEHRAALVKADVMPIGERPSGRSRTGFYIDSGERGEYLLLFAEATDQLTGCFAAPVRGKTAQVLASNAPVDVQVQDGQVRAVFTKPRSYTFVQLV
jgi:hypothetical protein